MEKNSSMHNSAADLFMERFPSLGLLMGTWEEKPLSMEEPPPIQLSHEEVFYFYGLSEKVYFECAEWLKNPESKLVFLEDEPGFIASFLKTPTAAQILSNPQVHIELIQNLDALAARFPAKRIEISGLSSKKKLKSLRLKILRKTTLSYALHTDRLHGYQPFYNFLRNLSQLPHSFYANGLKNAFRNVPAIICGAGPSLEPTIDTLRGLENKALIIAGGSTLAALSSKGVMPHFGMAIDPNLEEYRRFKNSFAFEVPLLYSTRVHPDIFRTQNGPFGYMRSGIGGIAELWMEEELGFTDPLLGDFLSPETVSVTPLCIAFAVFLGCNPILLNGIDMAYTGGNRYSSGVSDEKISLQSIDREKTAADRIVRKKDRQGKMVYSAVRWVMESASISHFAKKHKEVKFINTTLGGIGFKGIDFMPIEQAIQDFEEQNLREQTLKQIGACPMPAFTKEKILEKMGDLKESLFRVIDFLEILSGQKKGSSAMAEMELEEEIANIYLFYDIRHILKPGPTFWKNWLGLAKKYEKVFHDCSKNIEFLVSGRACSMGR